MHWSYVFHALTHRYVCSCSACVSACAVLPQISRGDLHQQIEWVLLEAHSLLLDHLIAASPPNTPLIVQRCQRLSALIKRATIPDGPEVMALQQRVHIIVYNKKCVHRSAWTVWCEEHQDFWGLRFHKQGLKMSQNWTGLMLVLAALL